MTQRFHGQRKIHCLLVWTTAGVTQRCPGQFDTELDYEDMVWPKLLTMQTQCCCSR